MCAVSEVAHEGVCYVGTSEGSRASLHRLATQAWPALAAKTTHGQRSPSNSLSLRTLRHHLAVLAASEWNRLHPLALVVFDSSPRLYRATMPIPLYLRKTAVRAIQAMATFQACMKQLCFVFPMASNRPCATWEALAAAAPSSVVFLPQTVDWVAPSYSLENRMLDIGCRPNNRIVLFVALHLLVLRRLVG